MTNTTNWENNPYDPNITKPIHIQTLIAYGGRKIGVTGISSRPVYQMADSTIWEGGLDNDGAMYRNDKVHINKEN